MAILSFLGSWLIIFVFLITADRKNDDIQNRENVIGSSSLTTAVTGILPSHHPMSIKQKDENAQTWVCGTCCICIKWLQKHTYRPALSTLVSFIAISILFRSVANLFSVIGYIIGNKDDIFCTLESVLRTYAALSSIVSITLIPIQYYAELFLISQEQENKPASYVIDTYLQYFTPYLIDLRVQNECYDKFTTLMYHIVFVWPLVIALLPLVTPHGYGLHNEELQRCTFSENAQGFAWAICSLFFWMFISWVTMFLVFRGLSLRGTLSDDQVTIKRVLLLYVLVSIICWLPLFLGLVFQNKYIFKYWEIVIQSEGFMYALVYFSIIQIVPEVANHAKCIIKTSNFPEIIREMKVNNPIPCLPQPSGKGDDDYALGDLIGL
jgi:hypothetical protein